MEEYGVIKGIYFWKQIQVIKNALDSMYDKLEAAGQFKNIQSEFEAIAGRSYW